MNIFESRYSTLDIAAKELSEALVKTMSEAISNRGMATLALSGGRTPKHVFKHLGNADMDWSRVTLALSDERWVPNDQLESNENLVRSYLQNGPAEKARFIPLYGGEETPQKGRSACERRLTEINWPMDAVYLGMGEDGHVASLFPGDSAVHSSGDLCAAVSGTKTRSARMTLTAQALLDARKIYLLFNGDKKNKVYEKALMEGSRVEIPLRLLTLQKKRPLYVFRVD